MILIPLSINNFAKIFGPLLLPPIHKDAKTEEGKSNKHEYTDWPCNYANEYIDNNIPKNLHISSPLL